MTANASVSPPYIRLPDIMGEQKRVHENALRSVAMEHIKYQAT
jgi:hypothetical protein